MNEPYLANAGRYDKMTYRRCGNNGLQLPLISLGLWQNFSDNDPFSRSRAIVRAAFDAGITHFDLANNYGPPPGSAEENFGKIIQKDFRPYRDEMIIATKAGYDMWPGPYGDHGSRKYMLASLDQSLRRMGLNMWIFITPTALILKHLWKKPCLHSIMLSGKVRHCTPVFPIIMRFSQKKP